MFEKKESPVEQAMITMHEERGKREAEESWFEGQLGSALTRDEQV